MKCPRCKNQVQDGVRYCTYCGYEFQFTDASENTRSKQKTRKKQSNAFLYVLLGIVLLMLVASMFFLFGGFDLIHHSNTDRKDPIEISAVTPSPSPTVTSTPTPAQTPSATPTPTPSYEPTVELDTAISSYLDAFIRDINNAEYWELYSVVQSGSAMEQIQKDFISDSKDKGLKETLRDFQITNRSKVTDTSYQLTVTESYEIWQNEDPTHSLVKQRCTYLVNRQSDGTWKIADFAGTVEVIDRTDY